MPRPSRLLALALLALAVARAGAAQEPPAADEAPAFVPDPDGPDLTSDPAQDYAGPGHRHYRAARLMLALPNSGRAQAAVFEEDGIAGLLEMNDGSGLNPFATAGLAAGARMGYTVAGDGAAHAMVLSPGIDLWSANPARETVIAPTLDLILRGGLGPPLSWEMGLSLGAGCYTGRAVESTFPRYFPLVGLSTGLHY